MNLSAKLLKIKLLWTLSVAAFIPMVLIAVYSYSSIKNQIITSEIAHLDAIGKLKAMQIESFYHELLNDIQTIQSSPYTKNLLLSEPSQAYEEAKKVYEEQLNNYLTEDEINQIYIVGLDGKVIVSSQKKDDKTITQFDKVTVEEGKTKLYFSEMYRACSTKDRKNYLFKVSAPILDYDNRLIGVVVIEFSANSFFKQIQDYSGLGESGETLLVKRDGESVIFLNPLRHEKNAGMKRRSPLNGSVAIPAILSATGHTGSGHSIDYRGVKVLASWRYVPLSLIHI